MKLYSSNNSYKLYKGNMLDMLECIEKNSIDSIVTDPPYELNFMGKGWDNSGVVFQKSTWEKCYNVLKPGGYLLAFGGSRTFHRIACAIEDVGFEIRDTIMWLYGSGFPKSINIGLAIDKKNGVESIDTGIASHNARPNSNKTNTLYESGTVGKEFNIKRATNKWEGWGTCLKPSYEPIIVARKPCEGSCRDNVIKWGVGGINIDECRVKYEKTTNPATNPLYRQQNADKYKQVVGGEISNGVVSWTSGKNGVNEGGRFPANTILTYDETDFEEVCGGMPVIGNGSASRYFYCAKASKRDRDEGLVGFEEKLVGSIKGGDTNKEEIDDVGSRFRTTKKNIHPTVKPTELMQYLIRLVTPKGGVVLDPFNGSGSTGKAAMYENQDRKANYKYIGIELTEEYLPIAKARIEFACMDFTPSIDQDKPRNYQEILGQLMLDDFI